MDPKKDWFERIWKEEEKQDPTHGGISKERAKEVFEKGWEELEDISKSAEEKNRDKRDSSS